MGRVLTVHVDTHTYATLQRVSAETGRSIEELAEAAIAEALFERKVPAQKETAPAILSRMKVGDSALLRISVNGGLSRVKHRARAHMGNPEANWSGRATNQGYRVTRIK